MPVVWVKNLEIAYQQSDKESYHIKKNNIAQSSCVCSSQPSGIGSAPSTAPRFCCGPGAAGCSDSFGALAGWLGSCFKGWVNLKKKTEHQSLWRKSFGDETHSYSIGDRVTVTYVRHQQQFEKSCSTEILLSQQNPNCSAFNTFFLLQESQT